jgi:hypothetical protein
VILPVAIATAIDIAIAARIKIVIEAARTGVGLCVVIPASAIDIEIALIDVTADTGSAGADYARVGIIRCAATLKVDVSTGTIDIVGIATHG